MHKISLGVWGCVVAGLVLTGARPVEAAYTFAGRLNMQKRAFTCTLKFDEKSSVTARLEGREADQYNLVVDLEQLPTPLVAVSTQLHSLIHVLSDPDGKRLLQAQVWSRYSLLDGQGAEELSGKLSVKDNVLLLDNFHLGHFRAQGTLGLKNPYPLDIHVDVQAVEVNEFLSWVQGKSHKTIDALGYFDGYADLSGKLAQANCTIRLESIDGHIKSLYYDRMILNLQGLYPNVELANSWITQKDGFSFSVDGPLDLSDRKNFPTQIRALKKSALVKKEKSESEWVIKRVPLSDESKTGEMLSKGGDLDPEDQQFKEELAKAHYNMGNIYYERAEYQRAVVEYYQAVDLVPNDPDTHYNLAFVSGEYLADQETALKHYQWYLYLKPNADDIDMVNEKIFQAKLHLRAKIDSLLDKDNGQYNLTR